MEIPLTEAEKAAIVEAGELDGGRHVTWAREVLLRAAKRKNTQ